MRAKLKALRGVIRTSDLDASREFYAGVLGLEVVESWDQPEGKGFIVGFGDGGSGGYLELAKAPDPGPGRGSEFDQPQSSDKIEIQIETESLAGWTDRLDGRWPYRGPIDRPWGQRYLWLRDPDNVSVVLFERLDPDRDPS